jgi:hypothetical protein|tara:strand:- start:11432 stop:12730 length:1299 start_codon:yes stop_codon:yes gene_type:complete
MDKIYFKFSWTNGSVTEDYIENWVIQVVDKDDIIYHEFYEYDIRNNEILTVEFSIPVVKAELYARFYINDPVPDNLMAERKLDMNFGVDRKFIRRRDEISTFSYEPKNCKTQLEYTQCTPVCGLNRSRYMLDVLKQAPDNGGIPCLYDPDIYPRTIEGSTQACESTICPDCEAGFVRTCSEVCNDKGESVETSVYKIQKYPGEGGQACLYYNNYIKYGVCGEKVCDSKYELFSETNYTGSSVTLGKFDTVHNLPFYPRSAKFSGTYDENVYMKFKGVGEFADVHQDIAFSGDLAALWFPKSEGLPTIELKKGSVQEYNDDELWFARTMRYNNRVTYGSTYYAKLKRTWSAWTWDASYGGTVFKSYVEEGYDIATSSGGYNFRDLEEIKPAAGIEIVGKYGRVFALKSNGRGVRPGIYNRNIKDYKYLFLFPS